MPAMRSPSRPVVKLLRPAEWAAFQSSGSFAGSPDDVRDGFIHLSTPEQAEATRARHFAGVANLVTLTLDADTLGTDLRWEPSRDGVLFPHLYRPLVLPDVVQTCQQDRHSRESGNPSPEASSGDGFPLSRE